jgi:radical SAM superfamily enzyme YgiQ (UPF0313 family)
MNQPGDILLISCYELGHQPLGLASPLGFLHAAGYPAAGIDASAERIPEARIAKARFIGISVPMHTAMRVGMEIAQRVRAVNPGAYLCFYGLYASLNAGYLLSHGADAVIGGEYEYPLLALVQALDRGDAGPVEGVSTPRHTSAPYLRRLSFALPHRSGLPALKGYAHLDAGDGAAPAGYVEASRGCLHTCLHCPITPVYRGRFFVVPLQTLLDDIEQLVRMGARHITFGDPDFLNGPGHALKVVRAMHARFPALTFDFTTKIEHILEHPALFPELKDRGGAFVVSALESTNDLVLARLEKGHTRADIDRALDILDAACLPMRPSLLPFTPWATLADYTDLFAFVEDRGLIDHIDPVQYTLRLLVPPGSALLDRAETYAWLGPLDEAAFTYRWAHPDPRMDRLHAQASRLVEEADRQRENPRVTFYRLQALARTAANLPSPPRPSFLPPERRRVPRLTESWFC